MQILTIDEIKAQYPNQWVLLANPELDKRDTLGSIVSKLVRGIVLFASVDKREVAYSAKDYRKGYDTYTCIFTGEIAKNRKFWL